MRTMFVAQENNSKKRFQKPNILRKRPKAPARPNIAITHESPSGKSLVNAALSLEPKLQLENITNVKCKPSPTKNPPQRLILDNNIRNDSSSISELYEINTNVDDQTSFVTGRDVLINNNDEESVSQITINIESFLNNSTEDQNITEGNIEDELNNMMKEEQCLDFIDNAQEIIIEDIDGSRLGSIRLAAHSTTNAVPMPTVSSQEHTGTANSASVPNLTLEYLANSTMNFKCDAPDCNKRFRSEQKLNKHKVVHDKGPKLVKQTALECPVKKLNGGIEEPCGMLYASKEDLVKHLNEDHNPEDAMYICTECGRRFFWAVGLRAHARAHCGRRAALACGWPGCGRVFQQPCRLREHMRAHTGDKPYPCRFPNCGWSFRTASKLLRHARRHTGERRHACGACGRAFRRREHLRDHCARHHHTKHACIAQGCQRQFTNVEALSVHMKKVHDREYPIPDETIDEAGSMTPSAVALPDTRQEETFMVNLDSPALDSETLTEVEAAMGGSEPAVGEAELWRAARTHCTWPLEPRTAPEVDSQQHFVPDEDVQVELSEGSESNIYTIRSDLFLHGNVLNNEDSEQMSGVEAGSLLVVPPAEHDLGLLDAHPTIDLMQEELMYTDSAVDESSFRVFLMSGEDLN